MSPASHVALFWRPMAAPLPRPPPLPPEAIALVSTLIKAHFILVEFVAKIFFPALPTSSVTICLYKAIWSGHTTVISLFDALYTKDLSRLGERGCCQPSRRHEDNAVHRCVADVPLCPIVGTTSAVAVDGNKIKEYHVWGESRAVGPSGARDGAASCHDTVITDSAASLPDYPDPFTEAFPVLLPTAQPAPAAGMHNSVATQLYEEVIIKATAAPTAAPISVVLYYLLVTVHVVFC